MKGPPAMKSSSVDHSNAPFLRTLFNCCSQQTIMAGDSYIRGYLIYQLDDFKACDWQSEINKGLIIFLHTNTKDL